VTTPAEVVFEHAPDHPVGAQSGPNGLHAWWCKRDDCDWRETSGPGYPPSTTYVVKATS
jgi:hypothetical protein